MKLFDSHAHYNDEKFDIDKREILKEVKKEGIEKIVNAGYSMKSSELAIELAKQYDFIYATIGISPNDIPQTKQEWLEEKSKLKDIYQANSSKIVAVGEIGLDYYWNRENKDLQKEIFIDQIDLANEWNLPIVIHTREAVMDTITILKKERMPNKKGVFHCCPLNPELVKEAVKLGFYISFAGPVTFKNSKNADEVIRLVPEERILIETDSPYLSPEPNRGKRNDSRNVKYIAKKIAAILQKEEEQIADITYRNACQLFEIK